MFYRDVNINHSTLFKIITERKRSINSSFKQVLKKIHLFARVCFHSYAGLSFIFSFFKGINAFMILSNIWLENMSFQHRNNSIYLKLQKWTIKPTDNLLDSDCNDILNTKYPIWSHLDLSLKRFNRKCNFHKIDLCKIICFSLQNNIVNLFCSDSPLQLMVSIHGAGYFGSPTAHILPLNYRSQVQCRPLNFFQRADRSNDCSSPSSVSNIYVILS